MTPEGTLVSGRYRLDQPIGRGRAGIVWLGFDTRLHRTVAVKRLYVPTGPDPAAAEQARTVALQEARDAMRVVHACAITVHDVLREGDDIWLVMEYVPSRNMADFLTEYGTLTPEQAAALGIQLGSALAAAHAVGVPHRVLQPTNVLLADDGGVKITDIGLSDPSPDPAYQAPEVARGGQATAASDAFSLGATLFLAVEGVPPFGEDGTGQAATPHKTGPLTGALLKLLRADADLRPTMADTVKSLGAITQGQQTAFVPPTAPALPTVPVMRPAPQQPVRPGVPAPTPTRTGPNTRTWAVTAVAIVLAVVVGVLFAELVLV